MGTLSEPIHGTTAVDTSFPAVVFIRTRAPGFSVTCTGFLVGNRTILTAAHCVAPVARGCPKKPLVDTLQVQLTTSGDPASSVTYAIDDIRAHGSSYPAFDTTMCMAAPGVYSAAAASDEPVVTGNDIAFLRLKVDTRKKPPFKLARPIEVITAFDSTPSTAPGAVHFPVVTDMRFGAWPFSEGRATPTIVGFGSDDVGLTRRRSGTSNFTHDASWLSNGYVTVLRAGVWNPITRQWHYFGVSGARGDSGSPLLVKGGGGAGAIPELPARVFAMGVYSRGDSTPGGSEVTSNDSALSQYPATFTPANRFLIEMTFNDWYLAERDWPQMVVPPPRF